MKPAQRLLVAILGYLLIGFIAEGEDWMESWGLAEDWLEDWGLAVAFVLCTIYILLALRAAAPGLIAPAKGERHVHPIQSGKARLSKRERSAMIDRV